jgi:hypothetical protein
MVTGRSEGLAEMEAVQRRNDVSWYGRERSNLRETFRDLILLRL